MSVEKHPNSDKLDVVRLLGWQCIVGRDELKVNDLCIYIEIDSILPDRPEFELARSRSNRIKTIKLRGVISQGIVYPTTILPNDGDISEGLDVTEILGIPNQRTLQSFFILSCYFYQKPFKIVF
ncbi:MAG: hypothetical protein ACTSUT_16525 [Promethearchaeota archaeon]